jgi:hypothetical protein
MRTHATLTHESSDTLTITHSQIYKRSLEKIQDNTKHTGGDDVRNVYVVFSGKSANGRGGERPLMRA